VQLSQIQDIITRTLSLSRESASPAAIDICKLTDEVLKFYSGRMELNRIRVVRDYAIHCYVEGFIGETRQVITNLLSNAVDAIGRDGTLRVRVRRKSAGGMRGVSYLVHDTGPGIGKQNYERIFQPFFTTKGDKGTGLGLWIVDEIVRRRGGRIRVRTSTRLGRSGTCFRIFLPDNASANAPDAGPQRTTGAGSSQS
jgi:signal transduction histidine kinase